MRQRNLDGYYFRVQRDGRWRDVCISDMTEEEMREAMAGRSTAWLTDLAVGLAGVIRRIGDDLDIESVEAQ